MVFQPVPNAAQVEFRYLMPDAVEAENRLIFVKEGFTQGDLDQLTQIGNSWVHLHAKALISLGVTYRETYARGIRDEFDIESTDNTNAGACTRAGAALPNESSLCVSLRTGFTGRSARGRIYWMPPMEADTSTPNLVTAAYANAVIGVIDTLISTAALVNWDAVVVQRWSDKVKLAVGVTRVITDVLVTDLIIDSQRGRKPG